MSVDKHSTLVLREYSLNAQWPWAPDRCEEDRAWVPDSPHCLDQAHPGPSLTLVFGCSQLRGISISRGQKRKSRAEGQAVWPSEEPWPCGAPYLPLFLSWNRAHPTVQITPGFSPSLCLVRLNAGLNLSRATSLHPGAASLHFWAVFRLHPWQCQGWSSLSCSCPSSLCRPCLLHPLPTMSSKI